MCSMLRRDRSNAVLGPIRALPNLDWQSAFSEPYMEDLVLLAWLS